MNRERTLPSPAARAGEAQAQTSDAEGLTPVEGLGVALQHMAWSSGCTISAQPRSSSCSKSRPVKRSQGWLT
jgi:hypothetical protein